MKMNCHGVVSCTCSPRRPHPLTPCGQSSSPTPYYALVIETDRRSLAWCRPQRSRHRVRPRLRSCGRGFGAWPAFALLGRTLLIFYLNNLARIWPMRLGNFYLVIFSHLPKFRVNISLSSEETGLFVRRFNLKRHETLGRHVSWAVWQAWRLDHCVGRDRSFALLSHPYFKWLLLKVTLHNVMFFSLSSLPTIYLRGYYNMKLELGI